MVYGGMLCIIMCELTSYYPAKEGNKMTTTTETGAGVFRSAKPETAWSRRWLPLILDEDGEPDCERFNTGYVYTAEMLVEKVDWEWAFGCIDHHLEEGGDYSREAVVAAATRVAFHYLPYTNMGTWWRPQRVYNEFVVEPLLGRLIAARYLQEVDSMVGGTSS